MEGKQTTLTLVCRANLAVRETLTVFNLACSAALLLPQNICFPKKKKTGFMIHAAATLLHTHIACNTSEERNVISRKIHFGEEFIFAAKYLSFLSVSGFG